MFNFEIDAVDDDFDAAMRLSAVTASTLSNRIFKIFFESKIDQNYKSTFDVNYNWGGLSDLIPFLMSSMGGGTAGSSDWLSFS